LIELITFAFAATFASSRILAFATAAAASPSALA
jgi:hypothetical protein